MLWIACTSTTIPASRLRFRLARRVVRCASKQSPLWWQHRPSPSLVRRGWKVGEGYSGVAHACISTKRQPLAGHESRSLLARKIRRDSNRKSVSDTSGPSYHEVHQVTATVSESDIAGTASGAMLRTSGEGQRILQ